MTGSIGRRLLAAVLLIFAVQLFSNAQAGEGSPAFASRLALDEPYRSPGFQATVPPYPVSPHPIFPPRLGLAQVVSPAGLIFSGQVTSVSRSNPSSGERTGSTAITFRVEQAIRGVSAGQELTIHEWAGLWANGERYRVGERVMLFLFPPSKLGFTSPVAGPQGRFDIDRYGGVAVDGTSFGSGGLPGKRLAYGKTVVPYADFLRMVRQTIAER
jgi:hypothetical protein